MGKKNKNEVEKENTIEIEKEIVVEKDDKNVVIKKKKVISSKLIIGIVVGLILIGGIFLLFRLFKSDEIKHVKKVLPNKYYNVQCLDNYCDQIAAYKGSRTGKTKVSLLTGNGKVVAKYVDKYDSKAKVRREPLAVTKNYVLFKNVKVKDGKIASYSIADKRGREKYKTENTLKVLNDNLVVMDNTKKGINGYSILNAKGKELFKNVNDYDKYAKGAIVSIQADGVKQIIDEDGKVLLSDYFVASEIKDKDYVNTLYLLVEDSKNNSYNYFSLKDKKIVGDSFQNYTRNGDGTLTISKKENNSVVKYTLFENGKQKRLGDSKTQSEIADELRKTIDSKKYNLYLTSIYDKDQKYVFADDMKAKSFGLYDIKKNKFKKLYDYKKDSSSAYSSISKLSNEKNLNYYQISCSTYSCDKNEFYVFDLEKGNTLYNTSDSKLKIQYYYQYGTDYKVIKYSYSSVDEKYKGKYVLYGKNNKEITKSDHNIVVVGEELLLGYDSSTSLILYSTRTKKVLNDDKNLGTKLIIDNHKYYRYKTNKSIILVNEKGKEVLNIDSNNDLIYSDKVLVYIDGNKAYIFDASKGKTKKYKLKNNEKMNDAAGDLISPYRGALFINNSADKYIKVVNSKGHVIKKIRKAEIESVKKNSDKNVVIITKDTSKKTINYGLYIAK